MSYNYTCIGCNKALLLLIIFSKVLNDFYVFLQIVAIYSTPKGWLVMLPK